MSCREFHIELERAIERRQSPSAATVAHFSGCDEASCRSRWREYLLIEEAVALWKSADPAAESAELDLTPGVLARFRAPVLSRETPGGADAGRRSSGAGLISAVAATVTVACVLFAISLRPGPVGTSPRSVDRLGESVPGSGRTVASGRTVPLEEDPLERLGMVSASWMQGATARVSDTVAFIFLDEEPVGPGEGGTGWFGLFDDLPPLEEQFQRTLRTLFDAEDAGTG
jgi:hypothetical protein